MKSHVLFMVVLLAVLCASAAAVRTRVRSTPPATDSTTQQPLDISADAPEAPATDDNADEEQGEDTEEEFAKDDNTKVTEYTYQQTCPLKYCPEDDLLGTAPSGYLEGEYTLNMTVTCGEFKQSFEKKAIVASEYPGGNYLRATFEQEVWKQELLDEIFHSKSCEEGPSFTFNVTLYKPPVKDEKTAEIQSAVASVVDKLFPQELHATMQAWKGFEICPKVGEVKSATYVVRPDYEADPFNKFRPGIGTRVSSAADDQLRGLAMRRARASFNQEHPPAEGDKPSDLQVENEEELVNKAPVPDTGGGAEQRAFNLFMQEQQLGAMDPRENWVRLVASCRAPGARQVYKTDESSYVGYVVEYYIKDIDQRMQSVSDRFDAMVEEYENLMEQKWIEEQTKAANDSGSS